MRGSLLLLVSIFIFSCNNQSSEKPVVTFDSQLANELSTMEVMDQLAASNWKPPKEFESLSQEEWEIKKDSIYRTHTFRLKEIIAEFGYPGIDRVGKDGEYNFWLMVQHADFDPSFQQMVLSKMKDEVEVNNADKANFAMLTDRVKINANEKQVYGTQVTYNTDIGQAIPKPLLDSLTVNERRKSVGLDSIEEYLNAMTQMHYEMNREIYLKKGITEPIYHQIPLSK